MNHDDTIAAIATAPGEAGIAIIRVSGPECYRVADEVFRCPHPLPSLRPPFTFAHGQVMDGDTVLDEALLLMMRAPRSYTGEDSIEIQGHGGLMSAKRVLRRVLDAGARLAEPGEFTKRAFLNGRIDLLQAESVLDLIKARSDRAASAAIEQLLGAISVTLKTIYDIAVSVAADLEATLDFPDDELPQALLGDIHSRLLEVNDQIGRLLATWSEGHLLREGALVVISGKPNVGKSTLMNALLGSERVIVSHIPGTTRDVIEEGFIVDGVYVRLVDTAGLRDVDDDVEKEGIKRARSQMEKADFRIYVVDASAPLDREDSSRIASLDPDHSVLVLNKIDIGFDPGEIRSDITAIRACLSRSRGMAEIKSALSEKIGAGLDRSPAHHAVVSERHRQLLRAAHDEIRLASELVKSGTESNIPLAADRLRGGLEQLGLITGRVYHSELLDSIFSRFCIGK